MAKLRHVAVTVPDLEEAAQFYEKTFEMNRVFESPISIMLSDGVMSLAILKFKSDEQAGDERGKDFHGIHHMGFVVDSLPAYTEKIESNGGKYHMKVPGATEETEVKFRDPNGVVFDIVSEKYATKAWGAKV